jgi:ribonucleotide monophosphatase NagD (HAD superfamily)
MGATAGMTTALVTTGVSDAANRSSSKIEPDYVVDSLAELAGIDELN